tara:strand:- start:13250 stop:14104 length:855 start_codon:yes stop_codon:yes gene_type:complete
MTKSTVNTIFGTGDLILLHKEREHADLIDWKFGIGAVDEASENVQGLAYAIGVVDKYSWVKTVTIRFFLPRQDKVSEHTFDRDDLEVARDRVRLIVQRATNPETPLNPTTDGCRYCGRRVDCPALADKLLPLAKKYESSAEDFELAVWENADPAVVTDPDTLSKMKRVGSVIERWKKAVDQRALELAYEEGMDIPGFGLYFRASTLKVDDANEAFEALKGKISADDFQKACSISLPALTKLYAESAGLTQKEARANVEKMLAEAGLIPSDDERVKTPYLRASNK